MKQTGLTLLVVGKPEVGPYRKLADRLGVGERVVFAGATGDAALLCGGGFFRLADIS